MSRPVSPKNLGLHTLDEIPTTESIFEGVDTNGSFIFRKDLTNNHAGPYGVKDQLLTERQLIAMILTEICCRKGRGKVR